MTEPAFTPGELAAERARVALEWQIPIKDECQVDGYIEDTYGGEHYWNCGRPGTITVNGTLMCDDHAGELGYGPKQEEYGFDPDDGHNPDRAAAHESTQGE